MAPNPKIMNGDGIVFTRFLSALLLGCALLGGPAGAEQIDVMNSGGFSAAYKALRSKFEAASGHTLNTAWGPSMGKSPEAIPNRLARGEAADVVIMVAYALDDLIKQGVVDPASRTELADSRIGMVVRAGAPLPDISTPEKLKQVLLAARSIGYSDSASGVYIERELFARLGVAEQVGHKARMIEKTPVAALVANGDIEIGFQQVSELLPVTSVALAGRLPESLQKVTVFAAGVPVEARHPLEGGALIAYLASAAARDEVRASGLDPK